MRGQLCIFGHKFRWKYVLISTLFFALDFYRMLYGAQVHKSIIEISDEILDKNANVVCLNNFYEDCILHSVA